MNSLAAASFAALVAFLPFGASAADDAKPAESAATTKSDAGAQKPHSHMQEKLGGPAPGAPKKSAAKKPSKDKHYHPRDK